MSLGNSQGNVPVSGCYASHFLDAVGGKTCCPHCLRLGQARFAAHLHRLSLVPHSYCPETINHFILECPRCYWHRVVWREQLDWPVTSSDLPTYLLAAADIDTSRLQQCFASLVPASARPSNCNACGNTADVSPGLIIMIIQ